MEWGCSLMEIVAPGSWKIRDGERTVFKPVSFLLSMRRALEGWDRVHCVCGRGCVDEG